MVDDHGVRRQPWPYQCDRSINDIVIEQHQMNAMGAAHRVGSRVDDSRTERGKRLGFCARAIPRGHSGAAARQKAFGDGAA